MRLKWVVICIVTFFSLPAIASECQDQLLDKAEAEALGGSLNYSIITGTKERVVALANNARTPSSVASTGRSIGCEFISANLNKYTNTMLIGDVLDLRIAGVNQNIVDSISYGVAFYTKALIEGDRSAEAMEIAALIFKLDESGKRYWRGYEAGIAQLGLSATIHVAAVQDAIRGKKISVYERQVAAAEEASSLIRDGKLEKVMAFGMFNLEFWFTALDDDPEEAIRAIRRYGEIDTVFLSYAKKDEPTVRDAIIDRAPVTLMEFNVWSLYALSESQFEGRAPSMQISYTVVCNFPATAEFDVTKMAKPAWQSAYESGSAQNDIRFTAKYVSYGDRTLILDCDNPIME